MVVVVASLSLHDDLTPEECELLEQKKNIAVGYLENSTLAPRRPNKLPEADLLFEEMVKAKPGDLLPVRNLAITRLLALDYITSPMEKAAAVAQAREAARSLLDADPSSAVAHLLAGKIDVAAGDETQAAGELKRAAELAPDDATVWYELFHFYEAAKDNSLHDKAPAALSRAYQAVPDNLAVQLAWLETQAEIKDPTIKQTIEAMRSAFAGMPGLMANVSARSNRVLADPIDWLGRVASAAEQADWQTVRSLVRALVNVVRPESWTQSDLRRLQRHPLDYVLHEFQTPCPQRAVSEAPHPVKVKLSELPASAQPPALAGVSDLRLADFDLDNQLDLIVLRAEAVEIYSRDQAGVWQPATTFSLTGEFHRLLAADLDRDDPQQPGTEAYRRAQQGKEPAAAHQEAESKDSAVPPNGKPSCLRADLDLVVYGANGILFLKNELSEDGTRSLQEVPQPAELADAKDIKGVIAADFYQDGDLDIAIVGADGLRLWSNRGDLTFTDITGGSRLPANSSHITSLMALDWDHDVDLDLVAANASGQPAGYLENLRHGQFRWRAFETDFDSLAQAQALVLVDADPHGSWIFATAGKTGATLVHTEISRMGVVSSKAQEEVSRIACDGLLTWDFDNDGRADLLAWNGKNVDFFHGMQGGKLAPIPPLLAVSPQNIRACRKGDMDGDGDEDLAIADAGRVVLYTNEGGNLLHWIDIELQAGVVDAQSMSYRSNHYGVGSIVEVRSGSRVQRRVVDAAKTHFGLGEKDADSVRIVWTTGVPQEIVEPDCQTVICDEQVLLGSCPYLYTWNGEKFEFYTDCLWSAPLGLLLAEGQVAPSREWEYLRIDGAALKPRDGYYLLQITEELWEAAYLDEVQLIAVDHPADVDIYSNEKVGPAEIARHKIHTVRHARRPIAAHDQKGRDVLDRICRRDGKYVKAFDRRLAFGHAEHHSIELDFGTLDEPHEATLFLTGWIRPSGTSMNVAISQNPGLTASAAPSLWAPGADGRWHEARSYIGFPGGKTKTIAVDLDGVFGAADYRLRVDTNMEIYWDEAFLTVDEGPVTVRQIPLDLVDADLHYRGFSLRTPDTEFGPEHYDYDRSTTDTKWPAMRGHFTRYGNVRDLLTSADDKLAVLGAGDELTLRFAVPPSPPPAGWKRDFLLYNVGWDKDADLNTVYGETVEPLPARTLTGDPYSATASGLDAGKYADYLRTYQTRTQDLADFWTSH